MALGTDGWMDGKKSIGTSKIGGKSVSSFSHGLMIKRKIEQLSVVERVSKASSAEPVNECAVQATDHSLPPRVEY